MNREFRIMRIRGIDITVGWSLLIIGTFFSLFLATGYFTALLPGWNAIVYLAAALFSFLGLYSSVLLHELAQAFVAQKQGLKVNTIVLNLVGSSNKVREESTNPRAAFWMAIVGPLTHLGLAGIFSGIVNLPIPAVPFISAIASFLMGINFLLGLFSLIPVYPMDGGRVLYALVWGQTKSPLKAARLVGIVGRAFGLAFTGLGLVLIVSGDLFNGLWMIFLSWFLINSARLGFTPSINTPSLQGVVVRQLLRQGDPNLGPQTLLSMAAQTFIGVERERVLPVVDQGYLLGTLSREQLRKTSQAEREHLKVEKVMTRRSNLIGLRSEDDLLSSMKTLEAKPVAYAAVIGEGGQFAGLLYLSDIARYLEMPQLLTPVETDPKPPAPTFNSRDGIATDPHGPHKFDKVA